MRGTRSYSMEEAKKALERYCVYQERCHYEVSKKLRTMRMIPQAADIIVTHLIEHNFLNEQRFADAFVRGKFRIKKWGRRRLVSELKSRHISANVIKAALNQINDYDYLQTFNDLAEKKFELLKGTSQIKLKRKMADYLFYRGWESHLVYDKIFDLTKSETKG